MTEVREIVVEPRRIVAIEATTTWAEFPAVWRSLLDEVWAVVRGSDPGRNVMLYKDDVPNVEIGVEADGPFAAVGRVRVSALPGGRVLTATHRGPYQDVGQAHDAIIAAAGERGLKRQGPRWEIYGHHVDGAIPTVDVSYLLAQNESVAGSPT